MRRWKTDSQSHKNNKGLCLPPDHVCRPLNLWVSSLETLKALLSPRHLTPQDTTCSDHPDSVLRSHTDKSPLRKPTHNYNIVCFLKRAVTLEASGFGLAGPLDDHTHSALVS
mmetsp:Transcript_19760/g.32396  ORF Transcript_19760/g.32396 Transcript_19760/m.32396 type:complete len:112 (-) Transcript_19760:513-848(-)